MTATRQQDKEGAFQPRGCILTGEGYISPPSALQKEHISIGKPMRCARGIPSTPGRPGGCVAAVARKTPRRVKNSTRIVRVVLEIAEYSIDWEVKEERA